MTLPGATRLRGVGRFFGWTPGIAFLASLALVAPGVHAQTPPAEIAAATDGAGGLPQPLSPEDAERYRAIFRLQDAADWAAADREIAALSDRRLLGHVLAERYLHPDAYRSSWRELADWLDRYADHPQAPVIHRLAQKRRPSGAAAPKDPVAPGTNPGSGLDAGSVRGDDASWQAGLDSWRGRDWDAAARQFGGSAAALAESPWDAAAAAFWAARSHLRNREPERVTAYLLLAARHPRSFYGQLARRLLAMHPGLDWGTAALTAEETNRLLGSGHGQRGLALVQIGETAGAQSEFLQLVPEADANLLAILLSVSQQAGLPGLALKLGARSAAAADAAAYPVPAWQPDGGFTVDRALVFAFVRLESAFNPRARNPSGAAGLMQLMPRTAGIVSGEETRFLGKNGKALLDPGLNLAIGQRYIERLLAEPIVAGDLLRLAAAYNVGPGNLAKWREESGEEDPLLFLESMPSREAQRVVERVIANYWIYQQRFGQETPSLDAVAAGDWPSYMPQDGREVAAR